MTERAVSASSYRAGLQTLYDTFEFVRGGESLTLSEAMQKLTEPTLFTGTVKGVAAAAKLAPVGVVVQGMAPPNYAFCWHLNIFKILGGKSQAVYVVQGQTG
jgi:hypothetical protein